MQSLWWENFIYPDWLSYVFREHSIDCYRLNHVYRLLLGISKKFHHILNDDFFAKCHDLFIPLSLNFATFFHLVPIMCFALIILKFDFKCQISPLSQICCRMFQVWLNVPILRIYWLPTVEQSNNCFYFYFHHWNALTRQNEPINGFSLFMIDHANDFLEPQNGRIQNLFKPIRDFISIHTYTHKISLYNNVWYS